MSTNKDEFTRKWITENAVAEIQNYEPGVLTLRGLHYRLVSRGMTNSLRHYKRTVAAMIIARWDGIVPFETFSDHDRAMLGETQAGETDVDEQIDAAKRQLRAWMSNYSKNRWENQPIYPEVFIEKKALQGIFQTVCDQYDVALGACKGYPSLTFLNDAAARFAHHARNGKMPVILYFGDYDPSGEDIPRSIAENLEKLGVPDITVKRISLMRDQVVEWQLPPAPIKSGDSRSAAWDGLGQVELDAVEPTKLRSMCADVIESVFDQELHDELMEIESDERGTYRTELKQFVIDELS